MLEIGCSPCDVLGLINKSKLDMLPQAEIATPQNIVSDVVDLLPSDVYVPESRFLEIKFSSFIQFNAA